MAVAHNYNSNSVFLYQLTTRVILIATWTYLRIPFLLPKIKKHHFRWEITIWTIFEINSGLHLSHGVITNCLSHKMYCRATLDLAGLAFILPEIEKSSWTKLHIYHFWNLYKSLQIPREMLRLCVPVVQAFACEFHAFYLKAFISVKTCD